MTSQYAQGGQQWTQPAYASTNYNQASLYNAQTKGNSSSTEKTPPPYPHDQTGSNWNGSYGQAASGNCYSSSASISSNKCQRNSNTNAPGNGTSEAPFAYPGAVMSAGGVPAAQRSTTSLATDPNQCPPSRQLPSAMSCRSVSSLSANMAINDLNSSMNFYSEETRYLKISLH